MLMDAGMHLVEEGPHSLRFLHLATLHDPRLTEETKPPRRLRSLDFLNDRDWLCQIGPPGRNDNHIHGSGFTARDALPDDRHGAG